MAEGGAIARVLIDTPLPQLDHLFDYRIPAALDSAARPGVRVRVPFRSAGRLVDGYLVERASAAEHGGSLSELDSVVSEVPVLSPQVWRLARSVADRGAGSAMDVLRLAIPPRYVRAEKAWVLATSGAQRPVDAVRPAAAAPVSDDFPDLAQAVANRERVALSAPPRLVRLASGEWVGEWATILAATAVASHATGASAILAVPDYRDQEQVLAAVREVLPDRDIVQLDARQPGAERYSAFLRCLEPDPVVVVGNRSAVYAPAERLGLLALWDDGDPLFAEPLAPYAHARDVALLRQRQQESALLFAGHSRSVEVQRLVELGWLEESRPRRAMTPRIILTEGQPGDASRARIPSSAWQQARDGLTVGPVLVQVARPGYVRTLACASCRRRATCRRCEGPLEVTAGARTPSCGRCGALAAEWRCPECSGERLRHVSIGAGRTAEELGRAFPGARIVVADGEHPLTRVSPEPALIVATRGAEPIAVGGYRAVLLLDGERMVARESLAAVADCLRWWSNAAALAAPGAPVVLVGVGGEPARALATWRQDSFAVRELSERRELRFPPAVRIASITGQRAAVESVLARLGGGVLLDVLGPVPVDDTAVRAIVRFGYDQGAEVATRVREEVIEQASTGRASRRHKGAGRRAPTLRVRFDDPESL